MDAALEKIQHELMLRGWKDITAATVGDTPYDLVASRRFLLSKWRILIRRISHFNGEGGQQFALDVKKVTSGSKLLLTASRFIFCVVADKVDPTIKELIGLESAGIKKYVKFRGGRGHFLVLDLANKEITGRVPILPYDAHTFVGQLHTILNQLGALPQRRI